MARRLSQRFGWGRVFALAVLAAFLALRAWDAAPLQIVRLKTFDLYQLAKPHVPTTRPVVIVDIDEASLNSLGQWPWPRPLLAKLVDQITAAEPAVIGFDIVFPEPDRTSPALLADALPELSQSAREELTRQPSHDQILAQSITHSRVVLGQSAHNPYKGVRRAQDVPKAAFATVGGDPGPYLVRFPELLGNIPELEKSAAGRGMFTIEPDPDGVVRRVPMVLIANDNIVPSLTLDMLRVAAGQSAFLVRSDPGGVESVVVSGAQIPTDASARVWVYFAPHDPARFISAKDVISGSAAGRLAGKLVLVGTSASGLLDLKTTPIQPSMPGVEVHAQVLENVLAQSTLSRPSYALGAEFVAVVLVCLAIIALVPILGAMTVFLTGAGIAALLVGGAWYLFSTRGYLFDVSYPVISSLAVMTVMVFTNYFREEAQRRQIRSAFSRYLSPDLVEELAEHPDHLVLGGETREMTIMFSDVRGFTSISESYKTDPQGLTRLMNRFLTPLSDAILEKRGTIDKYMGDAIMAFWNAPLEDNDHAKHACEAALRMIESLDAVNAERKQEAQESGHVFVPLKIGIGIGTGEVVVGNMGSEHRFDYSVLGDTVNLASRLEGQSKNYGVTIILGSQTETLVRDDFAMLELDVIRVKGKTEPEVIYALLGTKELGAQPGFTELREHVSQVLAAYRMQNWSEAATALRLCRQKMKGLDMATFCELYEARIEEFKVKPPPPHWDGIATLQTK
jgi:adenylate cyclase